MNTRHKILMGALALALPVGTMAALSPMASAKKAPPNPVTCTGFSGTVTFGTPISANGVATSSSKANATSVSGSNFTCSGGTAPNTGGPSSNAPLTINGGKNTKLAKTDPRYNKAAGIKYVTGSQAEFTASGSSLKKSLKTISFTIAGSPELFKTKGAVEDVGGPCPGEVGFTINGQVKAAPFEDKTDAQVTACLGNDTGPGTTNSFGVDLFSPTATIVTAQIDAAISNAKL